MTNIKLLDDNDIKLVVDGIVQKITYVIWGNIFGDISKQADLQNILNAINTSISGVEQIALNNEQNISSLGDDIRQINEKVENVESAFDGGVQQKGNTANGKYAVATGNGTEANGYVSFSGGTGTKANGNRAVAIGYNCEANATTSFAGGATSKVNHESSFVHGTRLESGRYNQVLFGRDNEVDEDALFVFGWGANSSNKRNTFVVYDRAIKVGDTKLTEAQLQSLLNLIS